MHVVAGVGNQRSHTAPFGAGHDDIAGLQGAALHQHGRDRAAAAVELGLDHGAFGRTVRIGLEVEDFGLQADHFEQLVDALLLQRRDFDVDDFAAHQFHLHLVLEQVGAHALRIGVGLVHLVDGDDHRDLRRLGVIDRLHRLRHDAVIGGDDQHHNVGDLGAARAHGGERRVARRIDEGDLGAGRRGHLIGADVLGDAAGFTCHNVGGTDCVEQRRLAVVDVTHDGDDGWPRLKVFRIVGDVEQAFFDVRLGDTTYLVAELFGDQLRGVGVDHVVDRHHLPLLHQQADDVHRALRHAVGEFLDGDCFRDRHFARDLFLRLVGCMTLEALGAAAE